MVPLLHADMELQPDGSQRPQGNQLAACSIYNMKKWEAQVRAAWSKYLL
jgi:hypothetical protein